MIRRAVLGLAAALPAASGCATTDGDWNVQRLLTEPGAFKKAVGWEEVKTPKAMNLPRAHLEMTERVETIGKKIIAQNTFTGIEPMFFCIGVQESVLFHRGPEELFISEGLVAKCKTEPELAALLCTELGQMVAEKRAVRRVGADRDSFPESALPGGTSVAGGVPYEAGRDAELAYRERQHKAPPAVLPEDAAKVGRDLLKGAGYDPAEFDLIQPLLKTSDRGAALRKQMSRSAPAPQWDQ